MTINNDSLQEEKKERVEEINQIAKTLLCSPRKLVLPIDINDLKSNIEDIYSLKIIIKEEPLDDTLSGLMVRKEGTIGILVNGKHLLNRKRFTLAHELGHLCLSHKLDLSYYEEKNLLNKKSPYEIEANLFASNILMPTKELRDLLKRKTYKTVKELSMFLQVSEEALWYKITRDKLDKYLYS